MPATPWVRSCFIPTDGSAKRYSSYSPSFENCGACVRHSNGSVITTCNPFYAGAYVWGRRPVTTLLVGGRLEKRQSAMRPAEECRVFIRDHHVGYVDWATYEENRRMMRRNSVNWQGDESMAA